MLRTNDPLAVGLCKCIVLLHGVVEGLGAWNEDVNDSSSFAAAGAEAFGATFKGLARIDRLPLPLGATTPADGLGSAASSSRDCSPSAKSGLDRCATSDAERPKSDERHL